MSLTKSQEIELFKLFAAKVGADSYFSQIATPQAIATIEANIRSDFSAFFGILADQSEVEKLRAVIAERDAQIVEMKKFDIRALRIARAEAEAKRELALAELKRASEALAAANAAALEASNALAV